MRRIPVYLLLLFLCLPSMNVNSDPIVYGIVPDAAPMTYVDDEGKPTGFFVELFEHIMSDLGIPYRIEVGIFPQLYKELLIGDIDLFTTMMKTPEREKLLYYPDTPAYSGWGQLFVSDGADYKDLHSLSSQSIGLVAGDSNGVNFRKFIKDFDIPCDFRYYSSFAKLMEAVKNQDIYGGVCSNVINIRRNGISPTATVFSPVAGYPVTNINNPFKSDLDRIMDRYKELKTDTNSYYYDLWDKWFSFSASSRKQLFWLVVFFASSLGIALSIFFGFLFILRYQVRKKTEELTLSQSLVENAREGIVITDKNYNILKTNRAFCQILGIDNLLSCNFFDLPFWKINDSHPPQDQINEILKVEGQWQKDLVGHRKDGSEYIQHTRLQPILDQQGVLKNWVGVIEDVTKERELESVAIYQAKHDSLTDLPNRRFLLEYVEEYLKQDLLRPFQLAIVDIDQFKNYNDAFGYYAGDKILRTVVDKLREFEYGHNLFIARLEGDEFCIVYWNPVDPELSREFWDSIINAFKEPLVIPDFNQLVVRLSMGVALYPEDGASLLEVVDRAYLALHRGKTHRMGQITYYEDRFSNPIKSRIQRELLLRDSLNKGEIHILYQPKLNLNHRRITGVEALIRWESEEGLFSPEEFVPIAEDTGLIIPIGTHVLFKACQDIADLNKTLAYPISVAINVSGVQFSDPSLFDTVKQALKLSQLSPSLLELEITETVAMNHLSQSTNVIDKFRAMGISIAMDDFGTGYSSLAYLKDYPLDVLKIDKSFIDSLPDVEQHSGIVETILHLSHLLNLKVVAEGVERWEQLAFLDDTGCHEIQGYLISKPISTEQLDELLMSFDYDLWSSKFLVR